MIASKNVFKKFEYILASILGTEKKKKKQNRSSSTTKITS